MLQSAIFGKAGIQILFKAALCFWLVWAGTWTLTVSQKAEMGMDKTEPWACLGLVISALAQRHKSSPSTAEPGALSQSQFLAVSQESILATPPLAAVYLYLEKYEDRKKT